MASQEHIQTGSGPVNEHYAKEWNNRMNNAPERPSEHYNPGPQDDQGWFTSLWSCCSPASLCCLSCCLPCITFGKIDHRMRNNGNLEGYSCCNSPCLVFCIAACCNVACIPTVMQRNDLREKYNIKGNCAKDFLASWCCTCCVLVQSDKEAAYREAEAQQRAVQTQQYRANNTGMFYPQSTGVTGITPAPAAVAEPAPVHPASYKMN